MTSTLSHGVTETFLFIVKISFISVSGLPPLNPTEVLIIYSGLCGLLYVEADDFDYEAPFMNIMPTLSLVILTLTLRVKRTVKLFTSWTFLVFDKHNLLTKVDQKSNLRKKTES
ncbi:hypothetical protein LOAG_00375 [Loa loa]|uniref:Uncharacterized protein n=1 Tax=Loa loa TaxID=7209 RepID=A0A1S0UBZ9_LOALO|nr:hypothetical protein LOAG_00375 [Loa loa]EFO28116.1 hypothetical protein LOAG_00375 [Loa loa]